MTHNHSGAVTVEVCVDSVAGALAARAGGAQRIEFCQSLGEGGLTPSLGTLEYALERVELPIHAMLRPRRGDFCYSDIEFEGMARDLEKLKAAGASGVVLGLLTETGDVDSARTAQLLALARPMSVTFHRAFDVARAPFEALETLVELGVDRLLTSGQAATALEGVGLIARLVTEARGRIELMAAAGIDAASAAEVVKRSGVRAVHLSARHTQASRMRYRNDGAHRTPAPLDEYTHWVTDPQRVVAVVQALAAIE